MIACSLVAGCLLLPAAWRQIHAHADVTYPEAAVVYNAQLAAHTGRIYAPISLPPYTPALYGPAYYAGLGAIGRAAALDLDRLLVAARELSFLCFWLVIAAAWLLARRLDAPPLFAVLAAVLVFADPEFLPSNVSARPDLVALALVLWAMALAATGTERPRRFALVGLLTSCALVVKSSYVAAPLAIVAWLLLARRWKTLAIFLAGAIVPAIACAAWLLTHGDPLLGDVGMLQSGLTDPVGALALIGREIFHDWPHVVILIGAVAAARRFWRAKHSEPRSLLLIYAFAAWLVAALTLINSGGNVNYLLEPWVVCSVLFAIVLAEMSPLEPTRGWAMVAVCSVAAVAGIVHDLRIERAARVADYSAMATLAGGRHVLSDAPFVSAHAEQPELLDPFLNSQLERAGRWDVRPIADELQQGRFDFVALTAYHERLREYRRNPFLSPRLLAEIVANYEPFCETAGQGPQNAERLLVWLPKRDTDPEIAARLKSAGCEPEPNPSLVREIAALAATAAPPHVASR